MRLPSPIPLRDAETNHVWVIVPLSRPENVAAVCENFKRQRFPFKKLLVAANGRAAGDPLLEILERSGAIVITTDPHQSAAKNMALAEVRRRGGGFTVVMDDDDWYGPQFLTELCGYARSYDAVGKARHFVAMDGQLWLCSRANRNRDYSWLTGGTIGCWAEDAPEYALLKWGEDAAFCHLIQKRGGRVRATDLYHYVYCRDSTRTHAWRVTPEQLRRLESERGALDLGPLDYDVVEGLKLEVEGEVLRPQEDIDTLIPPAPRRSA